MANSATAEHLFLHFAGDDKAACMRNTCNISCVCVGEVFKQRSALIITALLN